MAAFKLPIKTIFVKRSLVWKIKFLI
jgi:hypothetical protein